MRFFPLLLLISPLLAKVIELFLLKAYSYDAAINGKHICPRQEGPGYSYLALCDESQQYKSYNNKVYTEDIPKKKHYMGLNKDTIIVGPDVPPTNLDFDPGYHLDIGQKIWACKHVLDPQGYSNTSYLIKYGDEMPNSSCQLIVIQMAIPCPKC